MAKKKILFIDDEPDVVVPTKFILEGAGYEVYTAIDGQEGLKRFEEVKPDLVLLDIMMPKISGLEVLHILRDNLPAGEKVPIIMFTVKKDAEAILKAKNYGVTEYIVKTASTEELLEKIGKALSQDT